MLLKIQQFLQMTLHECHLCFSFLHLPDIPQIWMSHLILTEESFIKHQRPTCSSQISVKEHRLISFPWVPSYTTMMFTKFISSTYWPSKNRHMHAFGEKLKDSALCDRSFDGNTTLTFHSFFRLYRWSSFSFSHKLDEYNKTFTSMCCIFLAKASTLEKSHWAQFYNHEAEFFAETFYKTDILLYRVTLVKYSPFLPLK